MKRYSTLLEARNALRDALFDVANECGEDVAEDSHNDIVEGVADDSTPEVARELRRTQLR